MNKEQKSFWEYGVAWATTVVIHTYIRSLLKDRGIPLSPDVLHTYRDKKSHYGEVLKDAWRWRRICRNITNKTPKKHCQNCTHLWLRLRSNSCTRCKRNPDNKAFNNLPDYWMKGNFE